jgi:hypothetical protein
VALCSFTRESSGGGPACDRSWRQQAIALGAVLAASRLLRTGDVDAARAAATLLVVLRPTPMDVATSGAVPLLLALVRGAEDGVAASMATAAVAACLCDGGAPPPPLRFTLLACGAAGALLSRLLAALRKIAAGGAGVREAHDLLLAAAALRAVADPVVGPVGCRATTLFGSDVHAFFKDASLTGDDLDLFAAAPGSRSACSVAAMLRVKAGSPEPPGGDETLGMLSPAAAAEAYDVVRAAVHMCGDADVRLPRRSETTPHAFCIPPAAVAVLRARAKGDALKAVCAWAVHQPSETYEL